MNKKEIIKLLDQEVGLFNVTEDENSLGELYVTEIQFKEATGVLKELERLHSGLEEQIKFYKSKIQKNKKGFYVKLSQGIIIEDKQFSYDGDLIFLDSKNIVIKNCTFIGEGIKT